MPSIIETIDEHTKGLPTREVFDKFVQPESVVPRVHIETAGDIGRYEERLGFPRGPKGILLKQGLRMLQIPRLAEYELVGDVREIPGVRGRLKLLLTYTQGIPFSRLLLMSQSRHETEAGHPDFLGDPAAFVMLAFNFPKDTRRITPENIKTLRLQISPPVASFNSNLFDRSTPEGALTDEGRVAGRMISAFREAHALYVRRHSRGRLEINTEEAMGTSSHLVRDIAARGISYVTKNRNDIPDMS